MNFCFSSFSLSLPLSLSLSLSLSVFHFFLSSFFFLPLLFSKQNTSYFLLLLFCFQVTCPSGPRLPPVFGASDGWLGDWGNAPTRWNKFEVWSFLVVSVEPCCCQDARRLTPADIFTWATHCKSLDFSVGVNFDSRVEVTISFTYFLDWPKDLRSVVIYFVLRLSDLEYLLIGNWWWRHSIMKGELSHFIMQTSFFCVLLNGKASQLWLQVRRTKWVAWKISFLLICAWRVVPGDLLNSVNIRSIWNEGPFRYSADYKLMISTALFLFFIFAVLQSI